MGTTLQRWATLNGTVLVRGPDLHLLRPVPRQGGQAAAASPSRLPICPLFPASTSVHGTVGFQKSSIWIHFSEKAKGRHCWLLSLELFTISSFLLCLTELEFLNR